MWGSWMKDELVKIMSSWTAKEGCSPQGTLRDILTDLMFIADEQGLDFDAAVDGASDVYLEERDG